MTNTVSDNYGYIEIGLYKPNGEGAEGTKYYASSETPFVFAVNEMRRVGLADDVTHFDIAGRVGVFSRSGSGLIATVPAQNKLGVRLTYDFVAANPDVGIGARFPVVVDAMEIPELPSDYVPAAPGVFIPRSAIQSTLG